MKYRKQQVLNEIARREATKDWSPEYRALREMSDEELRLEALKYLYE